MSEKQVVVVPQQPEDEQQSKSGVVVVSANKITKKEKIIQFNGRAMVLSTVPVKGIGDFEQYVPLHKEVFERIAYPILGGVSRSRIADVFSYIINMAPDYSKFRHLIMMGDRVWDCQALDFVDGIDLDSVVWRCPWSVTPTPGPVPFIMDLAGGDEGHYEDIMQSMAALIMDQKPDGVIWWVGSGANGKSSLMEALYRLFPGQLASLTVKRLTDERDTPMLNGHLANVVKESSEGRIEDTQVYKSIGTHEDFRVHKFHSQDSLIVRGNMHHIFSANQVPIFNDKGYSARRRTFIIPFEQTFSSDPDFNDRTFTEDTLGHLLCEMIRVAQEIRERSYRYKFSRITESAKVEYDAEANNAEEYARELLEEGIVGFDGFGDVRLDYENWCADNGYVPLGMGNMRRSLQQIGFERRSIREDTGKKIPKKYVIKTIESSDLIALGMGRRGFYTAHGFTPKRHNTEEEEQTKMMLEDWGE